MKNKIILDSEMLNSEVLYIGQSIGKCNLSNAYKRLKNHTTLQQILAETLENEPYNEICIILLNLDNPTLINFTTSKFKGNKKLTISKILIILFQLTIYQKKK
ncbi:MAG TPA: hypothetical protein LFW20_01065 [Rickettsia endosymbiont of Omalisus fontisbellaquei]|nr:hypothetical protein [Rickettsia endosymbiont of Omalisus fontisbellaquei]